MNKTTYQYVQGTTQSTATLNEIVAQKNYTVLYFYPKNNTPGCTTQAEEFTSFVEEFDTLETQIVGVSKDSIDSHCGFIEEHNLEATYIADPDFTLHKQFGAYGEKNNYGKIVQGVIRSTFLLDQSGTVIKERKNVKAKGHAKRILEFMRSI